MPRRLFPLLLVALAAGTACAESDPAAPAAEAVAPDASTIGDAGDSQPPELVPPRMAVEPPPRRLPGADDPMHRCDAEAARIVLGQEATADVVEQARSLAGADRVRTLAPDQMVTMEYHPSRLNLIVDGSNVIVEVRCG